MRTSGKVDRAALPWPLEEVERKRVPRRHPPRGSPSSGSGAGRAGGGTRRQLLRPRRRLARGRAARQPHPGRAIPSSPLRTSMNIRDSARWRGDRLARQSMDGCGAGRRRRRTTFRRRCRRRADAVAPDNRRACTVVHAERYSLGAVPAHRQRDPDAISPRLRRSLPRCRLAPVVGLVDVRHAVRAHGDRRGQRPTVLAGLARAITHAVAPCICECGSRSRSPTRWSGGTGGSSVDQLLRPRARREDRPGRRPAYAAAGHRIPRDRRPRRDRAGGRPRRHWIDGDLVRIGEIRIGAGVPSGHGAR